MSSGSEVSAGPSASHQHGEGEHRGTDAVKRRGQPRVVPSASTIVSASTASTAQARKTETASATSAPLTAPILRARDPW